MAGFYNTILNTKSNLGVWYDKYNPELLKAVWSLNKRVRENKDWLDIQGATSKYNFE